MSNANENRSKMPTVAAFVDAVRAEFGDCKVIYAKENGIELGKKPERGIIIKPIKERKK